MSIKRNALGRGLGALLADMPTNPPAADNPSYPAAATLSIGVVGRILLTEIETNPYQPRTYFEEEALNELAESIKVHGIIQPITVRKVEDNRYQIISGERRFRASKLAGLTDVPAYILETDNQGMLEMALIENIQREDLNALEVSIGYKRLIDECNLKQEELAERVGKNRSTINNYLRLLRLPPAIQVGVRDGLLSMGHARAIVNVENIDTQLHIYKEAIKRNLNVRQVEDMVRDASFERADPNSLKPMPLITKIHHKNVQNKLSSKFESNINIKSKANGKGEIIIPFLSEEDLNRILDLMNG